MSCSIALLAARNSLMLLNKACLVLIFHGNHLHCVYRPNYIKLYEVYLIWARPYMLSIYQGMKLNIDLYSTGVCKIYEEHLKRINPNTPSITYDISQLFDFIDNLADLCCLVFQKSTQTYAPYNKDWIKEKIYILLRKQAGKWWERQPPKNWNRMAAVKWPYLWVNRFLISFYCQWLSISLILFANPSY